MATKLPPKPTRWPVVRRTLFASAVVAGCSSNPHAVPPQVAPPPQVDHERYYEEEVEAEKSPTPDDPPVQPHGNDDGNDRESLENDQPPQVEEDHDAPQMAPEEPDPPER